MTRPKSPCWDCDFGDCYHCDHWDDDEPDDRGCRRGLSAHATRWR